MLDFLTGLITAINLTAGIAQIIIGAIILGYVTLYKRMQTCYLIVIPTATCVWGITGVFMGIFGSGSIFEETSVF